MTRTINLAEYQEAVTPEDYDATAIMEFMESTTEDYVCTWMIYCQALEHAFGECPPRWQSNAINEVIEKIPGWIPVRSHRFALYGTQRAWKRLPAADGFMPIPEGVEIPFKE